MKLSAYELAVRKQTIQENVEELAEFLAGREAQDILDMLGLVAIQVFCQAPKQLRTWLVDEWLVRVRLGVRDHFTRNEE